MRKLVLLFVSLLMIGVTSCSKDEENFSKEVKKVTKTEVTTTTTGSSNDKKNDNAKLEVWLTGRDSYQNIKVSLRIGMNNNILEKLEYVNSNGKITFDVTDYIGKELVAKVHEVKGNMIPTIEGAVKKTIIKKGENTLTIKMPAKKVWGAKIKVFKKGKAQVGVKVYALNIVEESLLNTIALLGSKTLVDVKNQGVTDENGVVEFENLDTSISKKYTFIVVTKEPELLLRQEGEYKTTKLSLDGTMKETTIKY